jgi:hypothetical protein
MHNRSTPLFYLYLLIFSFLSTAVEVKAQFLYPYETKVDSIDIIHYDINLDVTDFTTYQLHAHTKVHFRPLVNGISKIDLDLIGLTVDSIKDPMGNILTSTAYTLGKRINLGATYNLGDSTWVEVYYHGHPLSDPNFGGFYFTSQFAFAVGIDIDDVPHNNGKTWFPCFDNFVEKSTFEFHLTIPMTHTSTANGNLDSTTFNPDTTKTDHWYMPYQNSTFVTSICVADFEQITQYFTNYLGDTIPCYLWARASDTTAMKASFINLEYAFDMLEEKYGPYAYDHIGYSLVPLPGGAMEHTMNIAYPISLANGSLTYQTVIYHELAHHWFSNNVTPRTAEDIWFKEGFAVYGERLFEENFFNRAQYDASIRNTHKQLLWTCHYDDSGYWPLSGVPQQYVYGTATYDKSADIIHTLRSYLGDSIFFESIKDLVIQDAFSSIDAAQFRDDLSALSGYNLDDFFDAWIFQGGWPHASIDSIIATPSGPNYTVNIYLKQKLVGRTDYSSQIPLTLSLRDDNWNLFEQTVYSNGANNMVSVVVPFLPNVAYLNGDEKISHAVTAKYAVIKNTGSLALSHANMTVNTTNIVDSVYMVIEHNWAAPDPVVDWTKGFTISPQRYWRVDGIWTPGSTFTGTIIYNGRTSGTNSRLDNLLITGTEDSLVLLYRPDRATDWEECASYTVNTGSLTDKVGSILINNLQKGEYALALKGQTIGIEEQAVQVSRIYPNPAQGLFNIECFEEYDQLSVTNIFGQEVLKKNSYTPLLQLDASYWAGGIYLITAYKGNQQVFSKKLVVQ